MRQFLADLRTKAWRTAGARYNAARRLRQREWLSMSSLALLSALTIAIAFAQKIYAPAPGSPLDNYLSSVAAGLGVLLLVISLLEWGAAYGMRAQELHQNAEQLTSFHLKLAQKMAQADMGVELSVKDIDDLRLEYDEVKKKCSTNHLPRDDALFRAHHRLAKEFRVGGKDEGAPKMGIPEALSTRFFWMASELWYFGVIWAVVIAALLYSFCIPKV